MPRFVLKIRRRQSALCHPVSRHAVATLAFLLVICSSGTHAQTPTQVSLAGPSSVRLGGTAQYSASLAGATTPVAWSVNGIAGGNHSTGPISPAGSYSPASTIFAGHSITITATTESTPASSASLRVRVLNPLPTLTSGSVTQTASGMSYLLDVRGSGFVPGSQLLVAGSSSPTVFLSSTELQSTISLTPGTATITAGILNPEAEQRSPVSMTLPVQAGATSGTLSTFSCSGTSMTGPGSDRCVLTLTAAAGSGGVPVKVTSSNASITVPATVTILPNATSAGFTATVPSVPSAEVVTLNASANGISKSFSLELNASSPALTVSVTSVPFGNVALNTSSTQPEILSSTGNAPVIIKSASVSGTGFTISGATFPVTLNPGLALTLEVQFNPIVEGTATGTLTIQSNSSSNGTAMVILNASGVAHHVDLSWEGPGSSAVPIVSYKIYRLANGGSAYQLLSSSTGSETAYVDNSVQSGATYDYIVTSLDSAGVESAPSNNVRVTIP
jgi:ASPM-SPD-2-Hydin domain-containing protein